jgi:hypothetical protein
MTKHKKIKKIKQLLEKLETDETEETGKKNINIPMRAIVYDKYNLIYREKCQAFAPVQLNPQVLADTVAVNIPDAIWAAIDKDGKMCWYTDKPKLGKDAWLGVICRDVNRDVFSIPCPVDDWKSAIWRIR